MKTDERRFWFCFAALQLSLCLAAAPLAWLSVSLANDVPAVIVTAVGAALCLASVALLCSAQFAEGAACLTRLLWLRVFTAGSGACAQLAAVGLLLFGAANRRLLPTEADAICVAILTGLAAVNSALAASACVHIYNCVTAVRLSWRVAAALEDEADVFGQAVDSRSRSVAPVDLEESEKVVDESGGQLELDS
ncbi:hypothetical protein BOX15_Mlig019796g1 [Macrostomum lignano]|nr:hypothetical protein BOX15_Mlig019796g2 [Macrostomum lignano]PAA57705.1 hypothetical protein BOX15_Mlig005201g1 [Macrostomum lignano]PAA58760.1 hypothetical protein BOX15_Mlig033185g1 [Macrostomum lignano]PAA60078.1 hypothetical protein BOX15_Mlig019796g1 [Macrostomum lignano]